MPPRNHGRGKIHAHDRMDGEHQRSCQSGEQHVNGFVPMPSGADPFQPRQRNEQMRRRQPGSLRSRIVARSGSKPTYQKTAEISRYVKWRIRPTAGGFEVDPQWTSGIGIRDHPESQPRTAHVNRGKIPGHITAKRVIASADRLTAVAISGGTETTRRRSACRHVRFRPKTRSL